MWPTLAIVLTVVLVCVIAYDVVASNPPQARQAQSRINLFE